MATNTSGGTISRYGSLESDGVFYAANGLDCRLNELTGQSEKGEAPLEEQIRLMRDQLEMLQSRILELEHSTRSRQSGAAENIGKPQQHEEDSSQVSIVKEEKVDDQKSVEQELDHHEFDDQGSEDQEPGDQVSKDEEGIEMKPHHTTPRLRRVKWLDFKNIYANERPLHAIDVLMGPARYYWQMDSEDTNILDPHSFKYKVARSSSFWQDLDTTRGQLPNVMPGRIRINYV